MSTAPTSEEMDYWSRAKATILELWHAFQDYVDPQWPPTYPEAHDMSATTIHATPVAPTTHTPISMSLPPTSSHTSATNSCSSTSSIAEKKAPDPVEQQQPETPKGNSEQTPSGTSETIPPDTNTSSSCSSNTTTTTSTVTVTGTPPSPTGPHSPLLANTTSLQKNRQGRSPSVPALGPSSTFCDGVSVSSADSQVNSESRNAAGESGQTSPLSSSPGQYIHNQRPVFPTQLRSSMITPSTQEEHCTTASSTIYNISLPDTPTIPTTQSNPVTPSPTPQNSPPRQRLIASSDAHPPLRGASFSVLRNVITTMLPNSPSTTDDLNTQQAQEQPPKPSNTNTPSTSSHIPLPHSAAPSGTMSNKLDYSRQRNYSSPVPMKITANWHAETLKIWNRKLADLPVAIDLPRLCTHISVFDCATSLIVLPPALDAAAPFLPNGRPTAVFLNQLLATMSFLLDGPEMHDILNSEFAKLINGDDLTEQKAAIISLLTEKLGTSALSNTLKGINQSILAPANIELRLNMCVALPFKDSQTNVWEIDVNRFDDNIEVVHRRRQVNVDARKEEDYFEFTWELILLFDNKASALKDSSINIIEFKFGPKTSEERRRLVSGLFTPFMFPKPPKTCKLLFPIKKSTTLESTTTPTTTTPAATTTTLTTTAFAAPSASSESTQHALDQQPPTPNSITTTPEMHPQNTTAKTYTDPTPPKTQEMAPKPLSSPTTTPLPSSEPQEHSSE
ncbi:hypothetical protein Pelo_11044 [Pelomyxa schiedti]|nr:hypothetical protein Pelo_11044 [Pelomyxa schiedti]